MTTQPDPSRILEIAFGFWPSKTLLSAMELQIFTVLHGTSMTGEQLRRRLELHPRATYDFLDGLVALGLLDRDGDRAGARYRNSAESALFLDEGSPAYVGGVMHLLNSRMFRFWDDLTEALKTGEPQSEIKYGEKTFFEERYDDPAGLEQFMHAMSGISAGSCVALAEQIDFSRYHTVCDVGGATAQMSRILASRYPSLCCTTFDLPAVAPIAEKAIASAGLTDRITVAAGDMFVDPLPRADVIVMSRILHDWNLDQKMRLIKAAYDALPERGSDGGADAPPGAFIVVESMIDDARRENVFGLMMSLNMLVEFGDAFDYTGADFTGWCREVGFREIEILPLGGPTSAGIAYK